MGGIFVGIVIFSATVLLVCARIRSCAIFVYVLYLVLVSIESSQGGSFCVFFFLLFRLRARVLFLLFSP